MAPVLSSILQDILSEFLVFFGRPWALNHTRVEYFLPPM